MITREHIGALADKVGEITREHIGGLADKVAEMTREHIGALADKVGETTREHIGGLADKVGEMTREHIGALADKVGETTREHIAAQLGGGHAARVCLGAAQYVVCSVTPPSVCSTSVCGVPLVKGGAGGERGHCRGGHFGHAEEAQGASWGTAKAGTLAMLSRHRGRAGALPRRAL